jgi:hypothetical protein
MSEWGADFWKGVANDLRGVAFKWWEDNREDLIALGKDEVTDIALALRKGDIVQAKLEIAAYMTRAEWVMYRDGTTAELQGIAARRAALLDALEDLGMRAATLIGKVVVGKLGL